MTSPESQPRSERELRGLPRSRDGGQTVARNPGEYGKQAPEVGCNLDNKLRSLRRRDDGESTSLAARVLKKRGDPVLARDDGDALLGIVDDALCEALGRFCNCHGCLSSLGRE
jgi:Fe-S cluster biogenesis protein NfuA